MRIKEKFKSLSMKDKLQLSFTLPIIIILFIIILSISFIFQNLYKEQILYSIQKSVEQVKTVLNLHFSQMQYLSYRIEADKDIGAILANENYGKLDDKGDIYREFYQLNKAFQVISFGNLTYQMGMYLDDEIEYTNNNQYFYPISQIYQREDIEEIRKYFDLDLPYYFMEKRKLSEYTTKEYFNRIERFTVIKNDGKEEEYISKVEVDTKLFQDILRNSENIKGSISMMMDKEQNIFISNYTDVAKMEEIKDLEDWDILKFDSKEYYYIKRELSIKNLYTIHLIPVDEFRAKIFFILIISAISILIMIALVTVIVYILSYYYYKRISTLNDKMNEIIHGNINADIPIYEESTKDEVEGLYKNFKYMTEEIRSLMKKHYRLGKDITRAEMRMLQAQINPHFLYNTLDLINWSALDYGAKNIAKIARDLGQFYRISLNHGSSVIRIADEIKHIESFVSIENVHYENAIKLHIDIPEDVKEYACLNIILQPFVENSIIHGIGSFSDIKELHIDIKARKEGEDIIFEIKDDGKGVDIKEITDLLAINNLDGNRGFGINNVNFRLRLCYGLEYGIKYYNNIPKGTMVILKIKALYKEELAKLLE